MNVTKPPPKSRREDDAASRREGSLLAVLEWPFVGRADELRSLYGLVSDGDQQGAVLAGAAGVGKTRLAREALRLVERDGHATLRTTATRAGATLPLGAFAGLLPGDNPPGATDDRADLLRRSATALVERAGDRRLVILVDDAHLLDDMSATLVHQLVQTRSAFILATTRTGDPTPDPVVALWRDGLADRIELGSLQQDAIAELLTTALDHAVDPATVTELATRARGNVLYLTELVLGALDDGALVLADDQWQLRGALSPSNRLVELVETRLEGVDLAERALLELVAYGEPLGEAELRDLADPALVESLERRALLTSAMSNRRLDVRLAHPVYGDVLRSRLPAVRERAIARALADVVETAGARRRDDALRVASWRLIGGGGRPEVLLAGATIARWRYDFPLAERLARAAVDAGGGFDAALVAAVLASLQGRTDEAEPELAALAAGATDDDQRGAVALARLHNSVLWTGDDRLRIIDAAEATITDPGWLDELAAQRLTQLIYTSGPQAVVDAALPLLDRAHGQALVVTCIVAAYSLSRTGRIDAALDASARGHAVHTASSTLLVWYPWWHSFTRCVALSYGGQLDESAALAREQHQQALAAGSREAEAVFGALPAYDVGERGRVLTAARLARRALAINQQLDRPLLARFCLTYGTLALALGGRAREAVEALAAVDALSLPPSPHHDVDLLQARAWTAVALGDVAEAHRHLERAAAIGQDVGDLVGATAALHGLARLGRARQVHARLADIATHVGGNLATARAVHARALADDDAAQLEVVSRELETMGADLLAAESAADAATAWHRAGDLRRARTNQHRASTLVRRCEGPVTPALDAVDVRAHLTPAEHQTALLAAAGRSNQQIADELYLSIRTVENRLHHVYEKLGIGGRAQLADVLGGPPE